MSESAQACRKVFYRTPIFLVAVTGILKDRQHWVISFLAEFRQISRDDCSASENTNTSRPIIIGKGFHSISALSML